MTKKISSIVLAVVMAVAVFAISAFAETELPPYDSRQMTAEELEAFFDDGNTEYKGDIIGEVYDALESKDEIFGMIYSAVEDYETAITKPYANYIVDFEISSKSDVSALLVGNYGSYGTIPVGVVNLKANEPINVMETASNLPGCSAWSRFTYADIVLLVKEFKCVAIPLTEDVLRAYHEVTGEGEYDEAAVLAELADTANPLGSDSFEKLEGSAPISVGLDVYESVEVSENKFERTETKYEVTEKEEFVYYSETPSYETRNMTQAELEEFFDAGNAQYGGDVVGAVYDALENPENAAFGVVYKTTEDYETAINAPYANYIVDFEIVSETDMSVLLVGNYGSYGTIPAGVVNMKAGVPVNVMETAASIPAYSGWVFTYADIVLLVKEFKCVAIPLTDDVLRAYHEVAGEGEYDEAAVLELLVSSANPLGSDSFERVDNASGLTVGLDLYATELDENNELVKTGEKFEVGEKADFVVYPTTPLYESSVLSEEELDAFFADPNPQYKGDLVAAIYNNLNNPAASVFGMNFKSVEDYETAINAPYAYYNPDFLVSSDKDVSAILLGNYGDYDTIPMGIVNIKAGESVRVVDLLMEIKPEWACNYADAVLLVKDFDGVAVVLSDDVIRAIYRIMCDSDNDFLMAHPTYDDTAKQAVLNNLAADASLNPFGAESFSIAEEGATLSLDVKLFETELVDGEYVENGNDWEISVDNNFDYTPVEQIEYMQKVLVVNNMAANDGYNRLNVAAAVDSLKFKEVGFKVTVVDMDGNYQTQTQRLTTNTVYGSMKIANPARSTDTVYTAEQLGGEYMFAGEILLDADVYTNANTKIIITPYAIDRKGNELLGKEITMTDAIIKNRTSTSALFRD